MEGRLLFRRSVFCKGKFLGFEYYKVGIGNVLTDITDKTNKKNWKFGDWEQCTGLKDRNNTLIWQNDIVLLVASRGYHNDKGKKYVIEFGTFRFCGFGYRVNKNYDVEYALTQAASKKMVVIGNVYQQKD